MLSKDKTDKRKSKRVKLETHSEKYYVEIPLSIPKGTKFKKEIIDISDEGISFLMPEEEGSFLVNTPLTDITVIKGGRKAYFPQAMVVYSEKVYGEGISHRIGLQFVKDTNLSDVGKKSVSGQTAKPRFRLPRYGNKQLGNINKMVTFKNNAGTYSSYEMVNFSKYGLAFMIKEAEIEESEALRVGEVLEEVQVIIGYKKVYEGRASVIDLREQGRTLVVGLKLEESMLEVDKILYMGKSEDIKNDLKEFLHMLPLGDKISGEFKQIVADMRYYLESIETKLNKEEARLVTLDLGLKYNIEKDILCAMTRPFSDLMNNWIIALNTIVKDFTEEEHELHKRYFQKQLHHLLLQSPFIKRSVEKPFGYSGDYTTISMISNNTYDGETLLGKLISKHAYSTVAARVVRLRKVFIQNLILKEIINSSNKSDRKRILSIGCGSAREVEEIVKSNSSYINCEFHLLDFDEESLYHAEKRLSKYRGSSEIEIRFVNKSIRALLKEKDEVKYDLIYSLGLIDYLNDNTCKKLMKSSFAKLKSGGILVIGQYDFGTSTRCYMEYGLEWYLIYRNYKKLLELADTINNQHEKKDYSILKNAYSFITITK